MVCQRCQWGAAKASSGRLRGTLIRGGLFRLGHEVTLPLILVAVSSGVELTEDPGSHFIVSEHHTMVVTRKAGFKESHAAGKLLSLSQKWIREPSSTAPSAIPSGILDLDGGGSTAPEPPLPRPR